MVGQPSPLDDIFISFLVFFFSLFFFLSFLFFFFLAAVQHIESLSQGSAEATLDP